MLVWTLVQHPRVWAWDFWEWRYILVVGLFVTTHVSSARISYIEVIWDQDQGPEHMVWRSKHWNRGNWHPSSAIIYAHLNIADSSTIIGVVKRNPTNNIIPMKKHEKSRQCDCLEINNYTGSSHKENRVDEVPNGEFKRMIVRTFKRIKEATKKLLDELKEGTNKQQVE